MNSTTIACIVMGAIGVVVWLRSKEPYVAMYYPPRVSQGEFYRHPVTYKQPGDTYPL